MKKVVHITIQDALQNLRQYGFQECTKEGRSQCERECLYAFEQQGDESGVCYGCETVDDVLALLSLVEASASQ
jgi:hypothetical protein